MKALDRATILLVDDDIVDVKTVQRGLKSSGINNPLVTADNGEDALHKLRSGELKRPLMILLDLNMPRMSGLEFLTELRRDEAYQDTCVWILSTSASEVDISDSYRLNVAGYLVKSELGDGFINMMDMLKQVLNTSHLPE